MGLRKSANFNSTAKSVKNTISGIAKIGAGVATAMVGATTAASLFVNKTQKNIANLSRFAKANDTSVQSIQALNLGLKEFGGNMGSTQSAVSNLNSILNNVTPGQFNESLAKMGVNPSQLRNANGELKSQQQLILSIAKAAEGKDIGITGKLISDAGFDQTFINFVLQGTDKIKKAFSNAKRSGAILTPEQIKLAQKYQKASADLDVSFSALKKNASSSLSPALTKLTEKMSQFLQENNKLITQNLSSVFMGIGEGVSNASNDIWNVAKAVTLLVQKTGLLPSNETGQDKMQFWKSLAKYVSLFVAAITGLKVAGLIGKITGINKLVRLLGKSFLSMSAIIGRETPTILGYFDKIAAGLSPLLKFIGIVGTGLSLLLTPKKIGDSTLAEKKFIKPISLSQKDVDRINNRKEQLKESKSNFIDRPFHKNILGNILASFKNSSNAILGRTTKDNENRNTESTKNKTFFKYDGNFHDFENKHPLFDKFVKTVSSLNSLGLQTSMGQAVIPRSVITNTDSSRSMQTFNINNNINGSQQPSMVAKEITNQVSRFSQIKSKSSPNFNSPIVG